MLAFPSVLVFERVQKYEKMVSCPDLASLPCGQCMYVVQTQCFMIMWEHAGGVPNLNLIALGRAGHDAQYFRHGEGLGRQCKTIDMSPFLAPARCTHNECQEPQSHILQPKKQSLHVCQPCAGRPVNG